MKIPLHALIIALGVSSLFAKVTNVSPKSEDVIPPKGTKHFSGEKKEDVSTPIGELIRSGRGVIEFVQPVTYIAEELDSNKAAADGSDYVTVTAARSSFPFENGRYRITEKISKESATMISVSDGWLVIQRGHQVQMIPVSSIKSISGWVPDQGEPEKSSDIAPKSE